MDLYYCNLYTHTHTVCLFVMQLTKLEWIHNGSVSHLSREQRAICHREKHRCDERGQFCQHYISEKKGDWFNVKCCIVCALYFWISHDPILLLNHIPCRNIKVRLANRISRGIAQKIGNNFVAAAGSAALLHLSSRLYATLAFCAKGHKEGESDT